VDASWFVRVKNEVSVAAVLSVDIDRLERLVRQLNAAAAELHDHAERFRARCSGGVHEAFGDLPEAQLTAEYYQSCVAGMLANLARQEEALTDKADRVAAAAAQYRADNARAVDLASSWRG
jgi:hypothetical protein